MVMTGRWCKWRLTKAGASLVPLGSPDSTRPVAAPRDPRLKRFGSTEMMTDVHHCSSLDGSGHEKWRMFIQKLPVGWFLQENPSINGWFRNLGVLLRKPPGVHHYNTNVGLRQCHLHHPPVTIFIIGGMVTKFTDGWFTTLSQTHIGEFDVGEMSQLLGLIRSN